MQPAIFLGHGSPMNAITSNSYTQGWAKIGRNIPKPKAILCISAHWYISQTGMTISTNPKTIHDFGGFPRDLYQIQYPAPGDPELAKRVQKLLSPLESSLHDDWGLDHGTWSVLRHIYPMADIPVIQLSINKSKPAAFHYDVGKRLATLREEGVLVVGSGNIVHNLHTATWGMTSNTPYDWAIGFENIAKDLITAGDHKDLIQYENLGENATLSIPTPDHYLPLLYVLGTQNASEAITFPVEGIDLGSVSMLSVQLG